MSLFSSENYHPLLCDIQQYVFAFLWNGSDYQIHGLWPDQCKECMTCGYPTCCNSSKFASSYQEPSDISFVKEYWYGGLQKKSSPIETCGIKAFTLLEHEVVKHGSCMNYFTDEYVAKVKEVYFEHEIEFQKQCHLLKMNDCELRLNQDFNLITPKK